MKDSVSGHGDFTGWPEEQRRDLLSRAIRVINAVEVFGFHSPILLKDFQEVFPKDRLDAPYFLCFQECVNQVAAWADKGNKRVACVFDRQEKFAYRARRMYQHLCGLQERQEYAIYGWLGNLEFGSRKEFPALRAADIIAFTGRKVLEDALNSQSQRAWWVPLLSSEQRLHGRLWDRTRLESLREELRTAQRAGAIPYVRMGRGDAI
jgi:hypothetical protein